MNIYTAAMYLKLGYRMRRTAWHEESYIVSNIGSIEFFSRKEHWTIGAGKSEHHTCVSAGSNEMTVDDMISEDWELITDGIVSHLSENGGVQYEE